MRDFLAPIIEDGFDCSGFVNRYSFQCAPFFTEGGNAGTLLDGSAVHDALAVKVRLSWTMNSLSADQYAALNNALTSGESPDTVRAYFFDPTRNAVRYAKFHVSPPVFQFAFNPTLRPNQSMSFPGAELALDEAEPIARFEVSQPTRTAFITGEPLDFSGFAVTRYDKNDIPSDITAQCSTVPQNGAVFDAPASIAVSVRYGAAELARFPVSVADSAVIASGDWWELYSDGTLNIHCVGDMPISSSDDAPWYDYRDSIQCVTIEDDATSIGPRAFRDCENLHSVAIPETVTAIGEHAFYDTALTSVTISYNATVGTNAFPPVCAIHHHPISGDWWTLDGDGRLDVYCVGAMPDFADDSGEPWYDYRSSILSVTIGDSVTSIGAKAFVNCKSLTGVTIPETVTSIGSYAFLNCKSLTGVTIPETVTSIGNHAFFNCERLTSVAIPNGVTSIGGSAFYGCALTSVTIPNGVTSIPYQMCYYCLNLTSVTIPDGVISIGAKAFAECRKLRNITMPDSLTGIGSQAFYKCLRLTDFTIPDGVTSIGWGAFTQCLDLTSITIPDGVHRITSELFIRCQYLESVTIPVSVTTIETGAFDGCSALTDVYYAGTEARWDNMTIESSNDPLINATVHYNSSGPS